MNTPGGTRHSTLEVDDGCLQEIRKADSSDLTEPIIYLGKYPLETPLMGEN
jgi:hypothetical protein